MKTVVIKSILADGWRVKLSLSYRVGDTANAWRYGQTPSSAIHMNNLESLLENNLDLEITLLLWSLNNSTKSSMLDAHFLRTKLE